LLARLAATEPREDHVDGLTWHAVTSATLAEGGRARNIIPDRFELNLQTTASGRAGPWPKRRPP
jgi:succinyl-diaminopimelate desuccinylase